LSGYVSPKRLREALLEAAVAALFLVSAVVFIAHARDAFAHVLMRCIIVTIENQRPTGKTAIW
jgi:hypothetical protein